METNGAIFMPSAPASDRYRDCPDGTPCATPFTLEYGFIAEKFATAPALIVYSFGEILPVAGSTVTPVGPLVRGLP